MNKLLKWMLAPYMLGIVDDEPIGGAADDKGGASDDDLANADRGDEFTPDDEGEPADKGAKDKADAGDADKGGADEDDPTKAGAKDAEPGDDDLEGKGADKGKPPVKMIPKPRFDELNRKSKTRIQQLEEELAAARSKDAPDSPAKKIKDAETEIAKLEADYEKALDDGQAAKATQLMRQIRQLDREIIGIKSSAEAAQARAIAVEQVKVDLLIDQIEREHPELDPEADEFDEDKLEEVMELRTAFEARGYASSAAIKRAVNYVFPSKATKTAVDEDDADATAVKAKTKKDAAAEAARKKIESDAARARDAAAKAAKASGKQPAATAKAPGLDSHKLGAGEGDPASVAKMSDKDFAALSEEQKARLRGDFLE
ncbi:hypothetical protein [Caldimonas sp. KR1-144]|uniref:hypothetical protein n=1 Tax=Caldimonas sp. KR1-144 TaxID=3400911 RepID=UPI003C0C4E4D